MNQFEFKGIKITSRVLADQAEACMQPGIQKPDNFVGTLAQIEALQLYCKQFGLKVVEIRMSE